jgi:hypothetical protein
MWRTVAIVTIVTAMTGRIAVRLRVAAHIPIAIQPISHGISRRELPSYRIVIARVVIV